MAGKCFLERVPDNCVYPLANNFIEISQSRTISEIIRFCNLHRNWWKKWRKIANLISNLNFYKLYPIQWIIANPVGMTSPAK